MTSTMTYAAFDAPAPSAARPNWIQRLFRESAYSLTALPIGVLTFSLVVAGLSAGIGLLIVWVGIPILVGTLLVSRGLAALERTRLRNLLARSAPTPEYVSAGPDASPVRRVLTPLRDPQAWLDTAWGIAGFVTSLVAFVVTVTWWAIAGSGLTYWFWERWLPEDGDNKTLAELIGWDASAEIWLNLGIGAFALLTLPLVVRAVTSLHAGTAEAMLSGRADRSID